MRATCFSIAGGALGIALIGGIFSSTPERANQWGARSAHEAFVGSVSNVTYYQIAMFVVAAAMVPLLRPLKAQGSQARPTVVEV